MDTLRVNHLTLLDLAENLKIQAIAAVEQRKLAKNPKTEQHRCP